MQNQEWTLRSVQVRKAPVSETVRGVEHFKAIHITVEFEGNGGRRATVRCLNLQAYRLGETLLLEPASVRKLHANSRQEGIPAAFFSSRITDQIARSIFSQAAGAVV